jgi:hypothetical protein
MSPQGNEKKFASTLPKGRTIPVEEIYILLLISRIFHCIPLYHITNLPEDLM